MIDGVCEKCGKPIKSYPSRIRRFCSRSCAVSVRNLTFNPSHTRDISGPNNPNYGKGLVGKRNPMYGRRNELSPRWKGGRKVRRDGYTFVIAPDNHPAPAYTKPSGLRYILEHRYVMEQNIGRYLRPEEVVHHIDGNPANNAIENLRLYANQAEHIRDAHGDSSG